MTRQGQVTKQHFQHIFASLKVWPQFKYWIVIIAPLYKIVCPGHNLFIARWRPISESLGLPLVVYAWPLNDVIFVSIVSN